eukprot:jgi/Galph1/5997/GphlegSOOS_G4600.1
MSFSNGSADRAQWTSGENPANTSNTKTEEAHKLTKQFSREHLETANTSKDCERATAEFPFPDPTALGLAGFSCTTFILSVLNAQLLPSVITTGVVGPGFFYGGVTQFIAGLMCFITKNSFGFVALTSYGAFWLSVSTLLTLEKEKKLVFDGDSNQVLGILLVGYAIFSLYLWIGSFAHHLALIITISLLEITLILLSLAKFEVISSVPGGITGIMLSAGGWYISAAIFINENFQRTVIPLGDVKNIRFLQQIASRG